MSRIYKTKDGTHDFYVGTTKVGTIYTLDASKVLVSDASGFIAASSVAASDLPSKAAANTWAAAQTFTTGIVGRTTAQSTGYIGEILSANASVVTAAYGVSNNVATICSLSLSAGIWLIISNENAYNGTRPGSGISSIGFDIYDGSAVINRAILNYLADWYPSVNALDVFSISTCLHAVATITTTTTVSFRLLCSPSSGTPTNATCVSYGQGKLTAVRIA
jgi:hypothetical protein